MLRQKYFLPKFFAPIFFLFLSQQPLFGAEPHDAVALPSANDSKVQSVAVASRREKAVLVDGPGDPEGKRYSGYVVWQIETIQQTGEMPDVGIRADIEIPERNLKMAVSIRGNRDLYLSASHKIEISFALPPSSSDDGVGHVHGVAVRSSEKDRGMWLASVDGKNKRTAKNVSDGVVVFRLSDRAYNQLELIDELSRLDVYMNYNTGRWALLTIEAGASGREIFEKALAAWKGR